MQGSPAAGGGVSAPDFLVIGAYKSGTTSLHHHLRQHAQVYVPSRKEPNFFAVDGDPSPDPRLVASSITDLAAYERLFAGAPAGAVTGEVSPAYLVSERAADRIRARVPEARLVAVLRDPVDRAWSDFLMYRRDGLEPCTRLVDALPLQEERRRAGAPGGSYLRSGLYGEQLARYYERFPRSQLHVLLFEDLVSDPDRAMAGVFAFLGVDPAPLGALEQRNASGVPRNALVGAALRSRRIVGPAVKRLLPDRAQARLEQLVQRGLDRPTLDPDARAACAADFRADVERLEGLLDRDLSGWLRC